MQDIADRAGVCKASVSLALRNDARLSSATRERIQKLAEEMGYRRNPVVDKLMVQLQAGRKRSYQATIGLVNCSPEKHLYRNHTFNAFRNGLKDRAHRLGYKVEDFWLEEPGLRPERLKQILRARNIHGLVLIATLIPHQIHDKYQAFWNDYACAIVGVTHMEVRLPCATNDQYMTAKTATEIVIERGYKRPLLVVEQVIDELLDYKFSAGFSVAARRLPKSQRLDPVNLSLSDRAPLLNAVAQFKPDVLITNEQVVRDWLEEEGYSIPRDMGLVHLDWSEDMRNWAGMFQNNEVVASAGADLVINQLNKNERGPLPNPKLVVIESDWVEGPSIRPADS